MLSIVPNKVLNVNLASVRFIVLSRESAVDFELPYKLVFIFGPFFFVQEIFGGFAATVEERYRAPVSESIGSVFFDRTASKGYTLLNEASEWCNALRETLFNKSFRSKKNQTYSSGTNHDNRTLGIGW